MGARFSAPVQTGPRAHLASCIMGIGSFTGVKSGWGVTLTPHSLLKERVELYLYSPYGPYGLYRASVPVQGCTLPFTFGHYTVVIIFRVLFTLALPQQYYVGYCSLPETYLTP